MRHKIGLLLLLAVLSATAVQAASFRKLMSLDGTANTDLHVWTDVVNVYVLRNGENAVLIDLGDGSVLDHLHEIGVRRVEWVLFTHHHREQSQGYPLLKKWGARIGAPEAERALFERPTDFRAMKPALGDRFTVHGASYVRPPVQPIALDRGFAKMDEFVWRGIALRAVETRGNSPGGMSYLWKHADGWVAFSGDVMLAGARMHNWFDTEWDYGFAAGIYALHGAASLLYAFDPMLLLPSHGPEVRTPRPQLQVYQKKLEKLASLVVRGYRIFTFASADQDPISKPTVVPHVWQVSPHVYKFKGADYSPNMHLILADNGHALAVDCGLFDNAFLDQAIERMRKSLGLKQIDACLVTHMHGDHMLNAPHLREKWGTQIWALDNMVDKMEHPERFDYVASVQAYRKGFDSVKVDRAFKPGETFDWQGYRLTVDWMPGQTEFALCLNGAIDGRKVAFTGDNIFANPADPGQNGHEAIVARNSGILEEGYIYGAEYLTRLQPDLILGGHSWVLDRPAKLIVRYRQWAYDMREGFRSLSTDEDYRYWFDPYWIRAEPYRATLRRGEATEVVINVRNFRKRKQAHRIEIHTPAGIVAEPAVLEGTLDNETRKGFVVRLRATSDGAPGLKIIALDVTLDGRRYGELFDFLIDINEK